MNVSDDVKALWQKVAKEKGINLTDLVLQSVNMNLYVEADCLTDLIHEKYCELLFDEISQYYDNEFITTQIFRISNEQKEQIISLGRLSNYKNILYKMHKKSLLQILIKPDCFIEKYVQSIREYGLKEFPITELWLEFKEQYSPNQNTKETDDYFDSLKPIRENHENALSYHNWLLSFSNSQYH